MDLKENNMMKDFINNELAMLDRSLVVTPQSREDIEAFAMANNGSNDFLLMQMAMNFGYRTALENMQNELSAVKQ